MALARACCTLLRNLISSGIDCEIPTGGIDEVYIACIGDLSITLRDCSETVSYDADGSGVVDPDEAAFTGDGRITLIEAAGANLTPFIGVELQTDSAQHSGSLTFDNTTNNVERTETVTFQISVKDRFIYCTLLEDLPGMEIVIVFREKGSNRYYAVGYEGDFVITEVAFDTGTTEFTPITVTASIVNAESLFKEVLFDTAPPSDPTPDPTPDPAATVAGITALVLP